MSILFAALLAIHGTTLSDSGKPLANAQVVAYEVETQYETIARISEHRRRTVLAKTASGADGSFSLPVDGYGVVVLAVNADGFSPSFTTHVIGDSDVAIGLTQQRATEGVVRSTAGPVSGARVIALAQYGDVETTSDASGKFALPIGGPNTAVIVLSRDFAPYVGLASDVITLDRGRQLRGRVVGPDHAPVGGARVMVNAMPLATSAADGTFTIEHVPALAMTGAVAGELGGTVINGTTVSLRKRIAVKGVVRDDEKHPLRGITIIAMSQTADIEPVAVTDEKGSFALLLERGKQNLASMADGYEVAGDSIDLAKPLTRDLVAHRTTAVAGIVRMPDGSPVAGARVAIAVALETALPALSMTRSDGRFRLRVPPATPSFRIEAVHVGLPPAKSAVITLKNGKAPAEVEIVIPKAKDVPLQVRDESGKPVAGVAVSIVLIGQPLDEGVTDGTGRATLRLAEGIWAVQLSKDGYLPKLLSIDTNDAPIAATLETAGAVRGRIVRSDGSGVAGAMISAGEGVIAAVTSGDDGSFAFPSVAKGPLTLMFSTSDGINGSKEITAPANDVRIVLAATSDIRGRVTDPSGAAVTDFQLTLASSDANDFLFASPRTISDPEGRFEWKGAPAGERELGVQAEGFVAATKDVTIEAGKPLEGITIVLSRGRTLRGKVTMVDGKPIAGVTVNAGHDMADAGGITTREDGTYEVSSQPNTAFMVQFRKEGMTTVRRGVSEGAGDVTVDAQLAPGRAISGHVFTADGTPVEHASVSARSSAVGAEAQFAQSGEDGSFTIAGLVPARYDFAVDAGGLRGSLSDVDVASTSEITIRMAAPTKATISGTVTGRGEAGEVVVEATSQDGSATANADASGKYRIENAPTGIVTVTAMTIDRRKSRSATPMMIDVAPATETHVDLSFPDLFAITGRVTQNQKPLANARLSFVGGNGYGNAVAAEDGTYRTSLSAGHYSISIGDYVLERDINADATIDISIDAAPLTVTVVDSASGTPIEAASISTRGVVSETHVVSRGMTAANGRLTFNASPDVKEVVAGKSGYATAIAEVKGSSVTLPLTRSEGAVVRLVDARDGRALTGYAIARDANGRVLASANDPGPDGAMRLPLLAGSYRFSASAEGYGSQTVAAEVPSSEIRLALPRGGKLLLVSSKNVQATARLIEPDGEEYVRCWCSGVAEIRIDGRATLVDSVAPGSYALEITPSGGKPRRIPVSVIEASTTTVNVDP